MDDYQRSVSDWKRVRSLMQHENELVNHRQTWLLNTQGFFFTALAYVYSNVKGELNVRDGVLLLILSVVAIVLCWFLEHSIHHGELAHDQAVIWFRKTYGTGSNWADGEGTVHPELCGREKRAFKPSSLARFFICAWIGIFVLIAFSMLPRGVFHCLLLSVWQKI